MRALLKKVFEAKTLTGREAEEVMSQILSGEAATEQIAALLGALQVRGVTSEELGGFLKALHSRMVPVPVTRADCFDTCGTGGDGAQTFNISTLSGLILSAAGVGVAKHGNRSVSSRCGSADVLEALGVAIEAPPDEVGRSIDEVGFGFLFAPRYHPALARVAPLRRALEVRTLFNALGPLANPARPKRQLIGVYDPTLLPKFAEVLRALGHDEAMVVASEDGLDEISLSAPTQVAHLVGGTIRYYRLTPEEAGLERQTLETLRGGDAPTNARRFERLLQGEEKGPSRDVVLLNAGAGLLVAGKAKTFREGVALAAEVLDKGAAYRILSRLRGNAK